MSWPWLAVTKQIAVAPQLEHAVARGEDIRDHPLPSDRVLNISGYRALLPDVVVTANDGLVSERAFLRWRAEFRRRRASSAASRSKLPADGQHELSFHPRAPWRLRIALGGQ